MESKDITVTLAPGHAVTLTTDAPDIKGLVDEIVKVKDIFDPDELKIDCEHEEFDKKKFEEIVLLATKDFLEALRLDEEAYRFALTELIERGQESQN